MRIRKLKCRARTGGAGGLKSSGRETRSSLRSTHCATSGCSLSLGTGNSRICSCSVCARCVNLLQRNYLLRCELLNSLQICARSCSIRAGSSDLRLKSTALSGRGFDLRFCLTSHSRSACCRLRGGQIRFRLRQLYRELGSIELNHQRAGAHSIILAHRDTRHIPTYFSDYWDDVPVDCRIIRGNVRARVHPGSHAPCEREHEYHRSDTEHDVPAPWFLLCLVRRCHLSVVRCSIE
jgi:hypothetical protein